MHIYECENGMKVPSVTTVLKVLGNESIIKWANYLGFKHIDYVRELDRYATRGTSLHTCLQHIVDESLWGDDHPIIYANPDDQLFCERSVAKFKKEMSKYEYRTVFTERTFTSSKLGYGGTLDWYAEMSGLHLINDFKSSKQVRMKHLIQIGGYGNLLREAGLPVDGGAIIICNPNTCKFYGIDKESIEELGELFNKIKVVYDVLEGPMTPYSEDLMKKIEKES